MLDSYHVNLKHHWPKQSSDNYPYNYLKALKHILSLKAPWALHTTKFDTFDICDNCHVTLEHIIDKQHNVFPVV